MSSDNIKIIQILYDISNYAAILKQKYKARAYLRGAKEIEKLTINLTPDNVKNILVQQKVPYVGPGITSTVIEFLTTGKVKELNSLRSNPKIIAHKELSQIIGVGPVTVEQWWLDEIKSIKDLKQAIADGKILLNNMQTLGLKYVDDLNQRIPRAVVSEIAASIKSLIDIEDNAIQFEVAGSYRRGAETSGDIDILITGEITLSDVITRLKIDPRFIEAVSSGKEKITFLYKDTDNIARQVDIIVMNKDKYAAALLYFTGNWEFNAKMRGCAKARGYRLNQNGLFKIIPGGMLQLVKTMTEHDIFKELKLNYIQPSERNIDSITCE